MIPLQVALERFFDSFPVLAAAMQLRWSWPAAESAHFIGLTLLFGSIAAWDLRLLGVAKHVPVAEFHRLVPFAIAGMLINMATGFLFLVTYPDQYVYNAAFHLKMCAVLIAGLNVAAFYLMTFRQLSALPPGAPLPLRARASGAFSLLLWTVVIVCGRMITFFRPPFCREADLASFLADCIVR